MVNGRLIWPLAVALVIVGALSLAAAGVLAPPTSGDSAPGSTTSQAPHSSVQEEAAKLALPQVAFSTREIRTVTVHDGDQIVEIVAAAKTVRELLAQAGFSLADTDSVTPPGETPLSDLTDIVIERAKRYAVTSDGRSLEVTTNASTWSEILSQAGVTLAGMDYTMPPLESPLGMELEITVIRVTEEYRFEDEPIPFDTVWQPTEQLELDQKAILSQGQSGLIRRRYHLIYEDGVLASENIDAEWTEIEPQNQVIGYGTSIAIKKLETPSGSFEYWRVVQMRATSYTASSSGKPPEHPAYGITASGVEAGLGVVAVDPKIVPFRSWVFVPGYGIGYAGDTGGGVKGRWIDLGYDDGALVYWNGAVDVYYLTPVPPIDKINFLLPEYLP